MRLLAQVLAVTLVLAAARPVSAEETGPGARALQDRQILVMLRMEPQHYRPDAGYGGGYGDGEGRSARWRIAQRLAQAQGVSVADEWPMPILSVDCFVMTVPAARSVEEVSERLNHDPSVSWSEPLHLYHAQGGPASDNDPLYRLQPDAKEWRLADLHQMATGRGVRVAVIDSMIDKAQVDLAGEVELVRNFVPDRSEAPEDHGTGVAGVIAARAGNSIGIAGVAPEARLMGLRACWQTTPKAGAGGAGPTVCDTLSLARALDFAIAHKAQVINMSLSGPDDLLLSKLLDIAAADRIVVVAAYDRAAPGGGFPALHRGVVAVADEGAPHIAGVLSAPGRDVPTTGTGDRWVIANGSSFSAAHVSGLYALLRQKTPSIRGVEALVVDPPNDTIDACATILRHFGPCISCARCDDVSTRASR